MTESGMVGDELVWPHPPGSGVCILIDSLAGRRSGESASVSELRGLLWSQGLLKSWHCLGEHSSFMVLGVLSFGYHIKSLWWADRLGTRFQSLII